jgi:hypothetical protein
MRLRKTDKILRPVHPNAGLAAEYNRRLDDLIADMQASYEYWLTAQYRKTPPIAMDADVPIKRVTAWEAQIGANKLGKVWFAYVDGEMLRGRNGVGRSFRSQAAAEEAGLRAAGPQGVLTEPTFAGGPKTPSRQLELELRPSPAVALEDRLAQLNLQWTAEFDAMAPKLARWFAGSVGKRSQDRLKKVLRDGGMTVKFDMTPAMRDIVNATITENVGLIKSIGSQYHTEVQGMVMRSITAGRDLGMLTKELEHRFGITRRRAAGIALSQNNLATGNFVKVRQTELGLQAIWLHSAGGKEPRRTHVANSGKTYDPAVGWLDPDPKVNKRIWPGQLINCRCVSKTVVKGFS